MLVVDNIEQLHQQPELRVIDLAQVVRQVALDLSPLIGEKDIDFEIATVPAPVLAHEWMLGELARNLLHNALKTTPPGGLLAVRVGCGAPLRHADLQRQRPRHFS